MNIDQWQQICALVEEALELPEPERLAYLQARCEGDEQRLAEAQNWVAKLQDPTEERLFSNVSNALGLIAKPRGEPVVLLEAGDVLNDRFRIEKLLGAGGMGEVYQVTDTTLNREVALKLVRPRGVALRDSAARFRREILMARRVTHPNVIRIFDVGRYAAGGGDLLFFTMELIEGLSLAEVLAGRKTLGLKACLKIVREIAKGLDALHREGIVHRDVKPSNVLIEGAMEDPRRVVVTDFGLAVSTIQLGDGEGNITATGMMIGTPNYMAPEQFLGQSVTPATDLYGLGLTTYEILFGKALFEPARTISESLKRFSHAPDLPDLSAELPAAWRNALARVLAPDPADRPQSVADFLALLEAPAPTPIVPPPVAHNQSRRRFMVGGGAAAGAALAAWSFGLFKTSEQKGHPTSGPAWEAYQRGRYLWSQRDADFLEKAAAEFRKAIELEPEFGLAYSGLADCHSIRAEYGQEASATELQQARDASNAAVRLASGYAPPHASWGLAIELDPWAVEDPDAGFRRAIALDPSYTAAFQWRGASLDRRGRFDEGSRHIKEARDRDPVSIQANIQLAWHYYFVNSISEALVTIERTLELKPDYPPGYALMALCYLEQQHRDRARELALHLEESRFPYVLPVIGHVMAKCGDSERTQQFAMELKSRRGNEPGRWAFHIACLHASLDEHEPARSWLQVAYDEREAALSCLCLWPYFDEMSTDPAVAKMRNQLGLALAPRVV